MTRTGRRNAPAIVAVAMPAAMEIMDRLAIKAAEAAVNAGYPQGAAALLIVELDGEYIRRAEPVLYPDVDFMQPYEWEGGCEDPRGAQRRHTLPGVCQ